MPLLLVAVLWAACVPHLTSPPDTAPEDSAWVPPDNRWPSGVPPADLEAEGTGDGQVPPDFRMVDQFGDTVALWQFWGLVTVLDISTMWCAPCQDLAGDVEATWQAYRSQGFVYVTVLAQDQGGVPPSVVGLTKWAEYYGITAPVLSDGEGWSVPITGTDGFPRVMVIDRTMRIVEDEVIPAQDSAIRTIVEGLL
ncbi:MAG: TlpA family protein disulfide reductase [Deltaproteobacteria bacterium]|nr:TlpA family protein disulfide reductase [Deltaproteobacteria bacterium]